MLRLAADVYVRMVGHCLDAVPMEACGLLAADPSTGLMTACYPTGNAERSARIYTVEPKDFLKADRDAEARGLHIASVFHSHTHTEAYPSVTDVAQAPDPDWHYVIISLRSGLPSVRSYRIIDGNISEEPVVVDSR